MNSRNGHRAHLEPVEAKESSPSLPWSIIGPSHYSVLWEVLVWSDTGPKTHLEGIHLPRSAVRLYTVYCPVSSYPELWSLPSSQTLNSIQGPLCLKVTKSQYGDWGWAGTQLSSQLQTIFERGTSSSSMPIHLTKEEDYLVPAPFLHLSLGGPLRLYPWATNEFCNCHKTMQISKIHICWTPAWGQTVGK